MSLTLIDYITGKMVPDVGAEGSRQLFEKFLVENRGYDRADILVDVPIKVMFKGDEYVSTVDLIILCNQKPIMAARCVAGSLGSYEREILAASRLVYTDLQIPFSVSTNGKDALVRDVISGKPICKPNGDKYEIEEGLEAVLSKSDAMKLLDSFEYLPFDPKKKEREMIIFRSYDIQRYEGECSDS
ncbi:MAG: type I restriction enzyme HsdR N-terminal domain-containing protein [Desulfamplus sp.]|nr:type I restriction enzyme HsdR N-terminal domain-containing protein [Desulfamplus sp.]